MDVDPTATVWRGDPTLPVGLQGVKILGTPVGHEAFVVHKLAEKPAAPGVKHRKSDGRGFASAKSFTHQTIMERWELCKEYTSYCRKLATKTVYIQQEELQEH